MSNSKAAAALGFLLAISTPCLAQLTEYTIPTVNSAPTAITLGPDGNLWFVETHAQLTIGRVTPAGNFSEFPVAPVGDTFTPYGPVGITAGPDGNIWICYSIQTDGNPALSSSIVQMNTSGQILKTYPTKTLSQFGGITAGSDGNLWFTETTAGQIGRITTSGVVTEFAATNNLPNTTQPTAITSGPDGALWFTDPATGKIGRITTGSQPQPNEYALDPSFGSNVPISITAGPDGALWFSAPPPGSSLGTSFIGRISTAGVVSPALTIPQANSYPQTITAGPDGNLWFTDLVNNQIDSVSIAGAFANYSVPTATSAPYGITAGADSALWFTENNGNKIGRFGVFSITPTTVPPAVTGTPYSVTLSAQGGTGAETWSIVQGSLPDGFSLGAATGVISGTPLTAQSSAFTVKVTDSNTPTPDTVTRAYTITVTGLPSFSEFAIPTASSSPGPIALGADGGIWFAEDGAQAKIGRVSTTGTFNEYPVAGITGAATFGGMVAGPDGNIWFTASQSTTGYVGMITPAGAVTLFNPPTHSSLQAIALGSDGALWFTEESANQIGRITTAGSIAEFPVTTAASQPYGITSGPDGNLWFTESAVAQVAKMTTAGTVTEYSLKTQYSGSGQLVPQSITSGPDGALWFTITSTPLIGRMTTAGVFTYFTARANSSPASIISGPDGSLWFTDAAGNQIDSITTGGAITQHTVPTSGSGPAFLTAGPAGDLWFTEQQGNNIGHLVIETTFREYATPTANSSPGPITAGPDGGLWFGEQASPLKIARSSTSGAISEYSVPAASGGTASGNKIGGITTGPDGNIWFTVSNSGGASYIASVTPAGVMQPSFQPPTPTTLQSIATGPDGNLWYTAGTANQIGHVSPTGSPTEFAIPTSGSNPYGITLGPDQALWFTEFNGNKIGRITTAGAVTEYPLPSGFVGPQIIVTGPDGNMYFTVNSGQIGQITTSGTVTPFTGLSVASAFAISPGPDGQEWFTDPTKNQIDQLGGAAYTIPSANSQPYYLTLGPDSALWFTESGASKIGRLGVPVIQSPNFPNGVVTDAYSATATAKGGTPPYSWSVASGSLPPGLSLAQNTGVISGVPSTAGSYPFTLTVSDSSSPQPVSSSQTASIVIENQVGPPIPLTILTTSATPAIVGTPYNFTLQATGGAAPYTWSATGLPPGLTLSSSTGAISGTPTAAGSYNVSINVSDSSSPAQNATANLTMTVDPQGTLLITSSSAPNGTVGLNYSYTFTSEGGNAPYTWTATGLPPGLSLSTAGVLSGTPTAQGSYSVKVQLTDSSSPAQTVTQIFPLTIVPAGSASGNPLSITGLSATEQPLETLTPGLQLSQAYATAITGTISLTFAGNAAGLPTPYTNPGVCFTTLSSCATPPQTTITFTIPAGSTVASLPSLLTGSVAGTITVTVTPSGSTLQPVTTTITVPATAPVIEANSVQITNVTSTGFIVEFVASSTPRDVQSVTFTFTAASGDQLSGQSTYTVNIASLLANWYSSSQGQGYGSLFSLSTAFNFSGSSSAIGGVYVTLTNSVGTSAAVGGTQ